MPRSTRSNWLRVARMSPVLGAELDAVDAPFVAYLFVAWGRSTSDQVARYELLGQVMRERGKWPGPRHLWPRLRAMTEEEDAEGL